MPKWTSKFNCCGRCQTKLRRDSERRALVNLKEVFPRGSVRTEKCDLAPKPIGLLRLLPLPQGQSRDRLKRGSRGRKTKGTVREDNLILGSARRPDLLRIPKSVQSSEARALCLAGPTSKDADHNIWPTAVL